MSKATIKMLGLALMGASVFLILFGLHCPMGAYASIAPAITWAGAVLLLVGFVLHVVVRGA